MAVSALDAQIVVAILQEYSHPRIEETLPGQMRGLNCVRVANLGERTASRRMNPDSDLGAA